MLLQCASKCRHGATALGQRERLAVRRFRLGESAPCPKGAFSPYRAFITRDTITGGVLGADQRVTRQQALRMATINNAWLTMEERTKGSIEPGPPTSCQLLG